VLAPHVNFFLNSRKQGLPCWRKKEKGKENYVGSETTPYIY